MRFELLLCHWSTAPYFGLMLLLLIINDSKLRFAEISVLLLERLRNSPQSPHSSNSAADIAQLGSATSAIALLGTDELKTAHESAKLLGVSFDDIAKKMI
jgi:hypothetical protein